MAKTVLIVDDHAPFRALARALLQLEGFEVVGEAGEMVVEDAPAFGSPAAPRPCPAGPTAGAYRGYAMRLRLGRLPTWWVGRSLATRPRAVTLVTRRTTRRPGEISLTAGSGIDKGHRCTCWPKPDNSRPCTPQTCDWRCRACRIHGRPFYSHADLQYLEHGTGPLAAELDRLWQAKGTMKGGTAREVRGGDGGGWSALPRGAAGLAPRRRRSRTVTELYYPGLQDPPPGHDGRNAGSGR